MAAWPTPFVWTLLSRDSALLSTRRPVCGILLTLTLITTLGIAIYESPPLQAWIEEQRRRIAELLRSIGEELDPQLRRQAEAFAFEGRTPATDAGLRREAEGSTHAAASATGRDVASGAMSRATVWKMSEGSTPGEGIVVERSEKAAAERRRLGREYLARRNQEMYEMRLRRRRGDASAEVPASPTSFDTMVDGDGKLKTPDFEAEDPPLQLPDVPKGEPKSPVREMKGSLMQPLLVEDDSHSRAWQAGSSFANPFTDEFELERSVTPKPPKVPPKVSLDEPSSSDLSFPMDKDIGAIFNKALPSAPVESNLGHDASAPSVPRTEDLSYEEQLAIALSLSESEIPINAATVRQRQHQRNRDTDGTLPNHDLRAAIEASLRDMDDQQAAHAVAHAESDVVNGKNAQEDSSQKGPLVDLTPDPPVSLPVQHGQESWLRGWNEADETKAPVEEEEDELYYLTPQLTRARLASHDAQQEQQNPVPLARRRYDPVREAATAGNSQQSQTQPLSQESEPLVDVPPPLSAPWERHPEVAGARFRIKRGEKQKIKEREREPDAAAATSFKQSSDTEGVNDLAHSGRGPSPVVAVAAAVGGVSGAAAGTQSATEAAQRDPQPLEQAADLANPETHPQVHNNTDTETETETEASWLFDSAPASTSSGRTANDNQAPTTDDEGNESESIEVIDITGEEDSDFEDLDAGARSLAGAGAFDGGHRSVGLSRSGIRTPDSWSEVGSRDGETGSED
ncbi:hypothetical protein MBLNU230_g5020t1 [Neophaeotheca triangularis]